MEYIQAKDLFPRKDLVKEDEDLQVLSAMMLFMNGNLKFMEALSIWNVGGWGKLRYQTS